MLVHGGVRNKYVHYIVVGFTAGVNRKLDNVKQELLPVQMETGSDNAAESFFDTTVLRRHDCRFFHDAAVCHTQF